MATQFMDFLMDKTTGDLAIIDGDFGLTATSAQSLRQRIEARFSTWKGEWSYNTAFGTPYKQRLLIGGVSQASADAEFIAQVNLEPDVTAVRNIQSEYDPLTRSYTLKRIEVYVNNEVIDLTLASPELTKYSYPQPLVLDEEFILCTEEQSFIDQSNELYELLNFDLPISGSSTWWQVWS